MYQGVLVKRTYVPATLPGAPYVPPVCEATDFTDFASLVSNPAVQWTVNLGAVDGSGGPCNPVGPAAVSGQGFTQGGAAWAPSAGHQVTVVQLDDPIRLAPVDLADGAGVQHTCSLQFDGSWVQGLPQVEGDLQSGALSVAQAAAKAIAIPSGTALADAADATRIYVFEQLAVAEYLADTADPGGLDLTPAAGLDLSTVPDLQPTGLGAKPEVAFKYSEGVPIE